MCHLQVLWALELLGGSVVAELRNPASVVAQAELHNPGSCAICQKQLHKQSHAILRVAQAELRNPGSCASGVAQSWELRKPSFAMLGTLQQVQSAHLHSPSSTLRTAPAAAPCSGTSSQAPKHKQHAASCSGTLQRQPATKLQSANSTLTAAPCSGTLQQQPATKLQSANSTLTAAPCSGTLLLGQQPSSKTQARNPTKELRNLSCTIRRSYGIGLYSTPTGQVSDPSLVAVQSWTLHRQKVADDHPPGPLSSPATRESNSPPPMPLAVLWGWADGSTNQPVTWPTCNTNRCVCVSKTGEYLNKNRFRMLTQLGKQWIWGGSSISGNHPLDPTCHTYKSQLFLSAWAASSMTTTSNCRLLGSAAPLRRISRWSTAAPVQVAKTTCH